MNSANASSGVKRLTYSAAHVDGDSRHTRPAKAGPAPDRPGNGVEADATSDLEGADGATEAERSAEIIIEEANQRAATIVADAESSAAEQEADARTLVREIVEEADEEVEQMLAEAAEKAVALISKAELEAAEVVAAANSERDQAVARAAELVDRAEAEGRELIAVEEARLARVGEEAAAKAASLIAKAEAEAAEIEAEAGAVREQAVATAAELVTRAEAEAGEIVSEASQERENAAARAMQLIEQAELEAGDVAGHAQAEANSGRDSVLEKERERIAEDERKLRRKQDLLAEAQEAFITERTVLQRRWAEVEKQGVDALERAHDQAERILNEARALASAITEAEAPAAPLPDVPAGTTAEDALARLDSALEAAREVVARRMNAEEANAHVDNDTAVSGVWDQGREDSATGPQP